MPVRQTGFVPLMPKVMPSKRLLALVLSAALVLAACGNDDGDDDDTSSGTTDTTTTEAPETTAPDDTPTTVPAETTTTPPETTPPCPPLDGGRIEPTAGAQVEGGGNLTDVAISSGDCTDVVTFTFSGGGAPGYEIAYEPGPFTQDGSGNPVPVSGGGFLVVRFEPAYTFNFDTATPTYTGPDRVTSPGALFTTEVVKTGDFEAVVTWVIGLDQARAYTATPAGTDPFTLTIEIR